MVIVEHFLLGAEWHCVAYFLLVHVEELPTASGSHGFLGYTIPSKMS